MLEVQHHFQHNRLLERVFRPTERGDKRLNNS